MSDLVIEKVETGYGHVQVLHGVDLRVSKKPVALMGRNGMGKTTLAQCIMGMLPITSGEIKYGGTTLNGLTPTKIARAGIAYVPQGRRVFPSLTVDEHLKILEKRGAEWSAERVYELFPRLAERKKNGGAMLSGGEQQMLAIGRALMARPKVLLLDEPSMGLAPMMIQNIFNIITQINNELGTTILLVEQNAQQALQRAHRAYVLQTGNVVKEAKASDLLNDPDIKAAYLGTGAGAH